MLGTNFSLMEKLFPGRDRVDLKRKFKSEEKTNPALVDKIISKQIPFDPSQFLDESGILIFLLLPISVFNSSLFVYSRIEEHSSDAENANKNKSNKDASQSTKITRKESKGKNNRKEKSLKKTATVQEPNTNEYDSDVVSISSIRSPYKKTSNEESEEDMAPPAKKGRKVKATESRASTRGRKTATRSGKVTRRKKVQPIDSDDEQPASPTEDETVEQATSSKNANPATPNSNNSLDNLLNSPLGQIGLEEGGLTVVEDPGTPNQAPSFLVPPALAEANPAFAQAEPGSLVLVSEPNPGDPNNQLVHVYRIAVPLDPVPL